ncbi:hypothetical protein HDV00_012769 [Rhizophlyctis rosea]|nr:hypothetical protein HDV00_012769 [Rhizophlyctis rosea]
MEKEAASYADSSLLRAMTVQVLHKFRDQIVINEKFVRKCFSHKLTDVIFQLIRQQEYFKVETQCKDLTDLCVIMACQLDNLEVFSQLTRSVEPRHILYAIRFGSFDFLMGMYKLKWSIRDFDKTVEYISRSPAMFNFKERRFLNYCRDASALG